MKINIIWLLVFWGIVAFLFFYLFPYFNEKNNGCDLHHDVYFQKINAKVEKKYVDTLNHMEKKIIYLDANKQELELIFSTEYRSMYDSLTVGDSIIKRPGPLNYIVKHPKSRKCNVFKFHTLCKASIK